MAHQFSPPSSSGGGGSSEDDGSHQRRGCAHRNYYQRSTHEATAAAGGASTSMSAWNGHYNNHGAQQQPHQQHEQQQQPIAMASSMRSNPIAIVRSVEDRNADTSDDDSHNDHNNDDDDDDIDDDEENSVIDVELDAKKIAAADQRRQQRSEHAMTSGTFDDKSQCRFRRHSDSVYNSLPTRLLRAPKLGSIPTNDDYIIYQNMLPPPMTLHVQSSSFGMSGAASAVVGSASGGGTDRIMSSYGSLRDSHLRGRFLDGPSSYRDRQTGDIRTIQHRVRFRDSTTTSHGIETQNMAGSLQSMSIGERLIQSRKQQQQLQSKASGSSSAAVDKSEPTSTLAAMLEASKHEDLNQQEHVNSSETYETPSDLMGSGRLPDFDWRASSTFYDREETTSGNMLSTSLTGLEILQRLHDNGSHPPGGFRIAGERGVLLAVGDSEELPRDANGHNALLARSYSDPSPRLRPRTTYYAGSTVSTSRDFVGHAPDFFLPPVNSLQSTSAMNEQYHAVVHQPDHFEHGMFDPGESLPMSSDDRLQHELSAMAIQQPPLQRVLGMDSAKYAAPIDSTNGVNHDPNTEFTFDLDME